MANLPYQKLDLESVKCRTIPSWYFSRQRNATFVVVITLFFFSTYLCLVYSCTRLNALPQLSKVDLTECLLCDNETLSKILEGEGNEAKSRLIVVDNQTDFERKEALRRNLVNSIKELYFYVRAQTFGSSFSFAGNLMNRLRSLIVQADGHAELTKRERHSVLLGIGKKIQQEIYRMQNPANCSLARKMICDFNAGHCGLNCELHRLAYCFVFAYNTNRTALLDLDGTKWDYTPKGWSSVFQNISNCSYFQIKKDGDEIIRWKTLAESNNFKVVSFYYLADNTQPFVYPAIPKKYADTLSALHTNAFAFYIAQFRTYFMRLTETVSKHVEEAASKIPFGNGPIVGVHVRRTDKHLEASFYPLKDYMYWAEEWFKIQDIRWNRKVSRRIFLATDEVSVIEEARKNYSSYEIFTDSTTALFAANQRFSENSLYGIITDIILLSRCDYLVCTLSSGVGRLTYELMQARVADVGDNYHSLDSLHIGHTQIATEAHKAESNSEIDLEVGDIVYLGQNRWNGFSYGQNHRTKKNGLFPSYKTVDHWITYQRRLE